VTKWIGKTLGLALGGGGVRGFSHIGVLKVFEQQGIQIDLIVGSSAGALIGGAYAAGRSPDEIQRLVDAYIKSPEFKASELNAIGLTVCPSERTWGEKVRKALRERYYLIRSLFKPSILPAMDFESLINHFLPDIDIRATRIPFHVVATDLITGKKIVISRGPLRKAVQASCSVPGAVDPVRMGEWLLADGGITSLVPVLSAREAGADVVIAVVVDRKKQGQAQYETAQDIFCRAGEITSDELEEAELQHADVVIRPNVGDLHWADFRRASGLVREGEIATMNALDVIQGAVPIYRKVLRLMRKFIPRLPPAQR
jgi:NTE family protein